MSQHSDANLCLLDRVTVDQLMAPALATRSFAEICGTIELQESPRCWCLPMPCVGARTLKGRRAKRPPQERASSTAAVARKTRGREVSTGPWQRPIMWCGSPTCGTLAASGSLLYSSDAVRTPCFQRVHGAMLKSDDLNRVNPEFFVVSLEGGLLMKKRT